MNELFHHIAHKISELAGSAKAFFGALTLIIIWAIAGPVFNFSNTWQLVINTATTILTFLMVFLIQNTQNRDAKAVHLKLDALLKSGKNTTEREMIGLEEDSDLEIEQLEERFRKLHDQIEKRKNRIAQSKIGQK